MTWVNSAASISLLLFLASPAPFDEEGDVLHRDEEAVLRVGHHVVILGPDQGVVVRGQVYDPSAGGRRRARILSSEGSSLRQSSSWWMPSSSSPALFTHSRAERSALSSLASSSPLPGSTTADVREPFCLRKGLRLGQMKYGFAIPFRSWRSL